MAHSGFPLKPFLPVTIGHNANNLSMLLFGSGGDGEVIDFVLQWHSLKQIIDVCLAGHMLTVE